MKLVGKSIRPFIGAKNYTTSRNFYQDLGFEEIIISKILSYFRMGEFGFYLQNYYAKEWIDNSMIFFELDELESNLESMQNLQLPQKYENVRLSKIVYNDWGNEFFLHDPSGILWHFGKFNSKT